MSKAVLEVLRSSMIKHTSITEERAKDLAELLYDDLDANFTLNWKNAITDPPENDDDVLVCWLGWDDQIIKRTLSYDPPHKEWGDWKGDVYKEEVMYWVPLPEAPEKL